MDNKHAQYDEYAKKWLRTRSACEGQEAVHAQGVTFLPKLAEQKETDYQSYKMRATYFNACGRTLEGLVGMVFRKDPAKKYPTAFQSIIDDIDLSGNSCDTVAMKVLAEVITVGRIGALVEYPQVTQEVNSMADASRLNLRPYLTLYKAENILDWRVQRVNNSMQPVMIKLLEMYEVSEDIFTYECKEQIRVLLLDNGIYLQRIYRTNDKGEWEQFGDDIIPLMSNQPLRAIPFWPFGAETNSLYLQQPPILDLADLNLAHYRVNADYERGCHFAGLPTPVLAGFTFDDGASVAIGSTTCMTTSDPNAKWGFLEFTGQGLGALEKNLDSKEKQMAAIGARMLEQQKTGVESEGAMQMRSNGENSVLAALANLVSENFKQIITFMAQWSGLTVTEDAIEYKLNTDYMPVGMTSQQLAELVKALQANAISFETFFWNLKRGEVIGDDTTLEDERERIESAAPVLSTENA